MLQCNRIPDFIRVITEEKTVCLLCENDFKYEDIHVAFLKTKESLQVQLTADTTPIKFLVLRWNGDCKEFKSVLGDAFERSYGNLCWKGIDPQRVMPWYMVLSGDQYSVGIGVKVRPNAMAFFMSDSQGITLWLDVRCGVQGVLLNERTLDAAEIVQYKSEAEAASVFQFCKQFLRYLCEDPLLPEKPVYGSNNWYYAYGNSSAEQILRDAELLAELTEGLENRPYMVIDDCWQELALTKGAAGRPYERGNQRFPDMKQLADQIRSKGVIPGIWIRPLETMEMFLKRELKGMRSQQTLDPSVSEALALIAEDVQRVVSWGYKLIKYDFATFDFYGEFFADNKRVLKQTGWTLHDRSKTSAECIKDLYWTIYNNAANALILGCNVIGHLAAGFIHIHRSGDDTSGNSFDRTVMMGVNTLAFRLPQHKTFFHMDADCVGITGNIPWEYNKRFLNLLENSGTPLFISLKPEEATEEIKKDLKHAFFKASRQDYNMEPLDWMSTVIPELYDVNGEKTEYKWIKEQGLDWFDSI